MTKGKGVVEVRLLGPFEIRADGQALALGGAKQRAVLVTLALRAGEVVSVERLVDEVWGDAPPPSAGHSLEAYISRLRRLLARHDVSVVRRGAGYSLELGDALLDSRLFEKLLDDACRAQAEHDQATAAQLASKALDLWRGPALADVSLGASGRGERERLEELRLRALEVRFDAKLALGGHEALVGELQLLVSQNPYRERFVAQLMLALYRSGRHADALEVYETTRSALSEDLGLQPSEELQQLSGQIVRQEPQLRRPTPAAPPVQPRGFGRRVRRVGGLVLAGIIVTMTMTFTASGSAPHAKTVAPVTATRVALVLPRAPDTAMDDVRIRETTAAFRESVSAWGLEGETLVADVIEPTPAEVDRIVRRLEAGGFALVLVSGGGTTARALAPVVARLTHTQFVFIDASLAMLSLGGVSNATGMPFADHQSSRLAGYLSGLVPPRGGMPKERADMVSIVASPGTPRVERLVHAFERGVRQALPRITIRVDYTTSERDKTACERLANDQIDAGSDVVYAVAGDCSSPALAVAKLRGVWAIRVADDGVPDGPHIIATTHKRWGKAVTEALNGFALDALPRGRDRVLGLADDYAVDAWGGSPPEVHAAWSKVVRLCSKIREHSETVAP